MVFSTREYSLKIFEYVRVKFGLITHQQWVFWTLLLLLGKSIEYYGNSYMIGIGWSLIAYSLIAPISYMSKCYIDAISSLNTSYFQPHRITIDEEGLFIQICEGNSYFVRWASIGKIHKSASSFVLFLTKEIYIIIPYRSFETRLDKMDFEYLLNKQKFGMQSVVVGKHSDVRSD